MVNGKIELEVFSRKEPLSPNTKKNGKVSKKNYNPNTDDKCDEGYILDEDEGKSGNSIRSIKKSSGKVKRKTTRRDTNSTNQNIGETIKIVNSVEARNVKDMIKRSKSIASKTKKETRKKSVVNKRKSIDKVIKNDQQNEAD